MDYNISYRNKDKGIQAIISYKDNDGKWKQKSKQGFTRQKDAKPWIKKTTEELEKNIKVAEDFRGITFGEFKDVYLQDKKRHATNTILCYKNAYKSFEALNDMPLTEISYINIKPCIDKMIDVDGLKKSTIDKYMTCIASTLNHAKNIYKIIVENPLYKKQYELPKENKKKKINALNKDELDSLLSKLEGMDYIISLIASKCGLRIGEIIGLQDTAFNFGSAEVTIDKQWKVIAESGACGFGSPKSVNSSRTVPIPSSYVHEIKKYVTGCVIGIDRRIFPDARTTNACTRLNAKFKRCGHLATVHDLRHTYATTLLFNGFDYKTVAELMGDTVDTIIKNYSHFIDDMYESAKERIDNIL